MERKVVHDNIEFSFFGIGRSESFESGQNIRYAFSFVNRSSQAVLVDIIERQHLLSTR